MSVIDKEIERQIDLENGEHVIIKTLRCTDKDGNDFDVDIQPGAYVEIVINNPYGCAVLSPNQARELAAKILDEMPAEEE